MKTTSPLDYIPSASVIRDRLTGVESEAAKLRILLEVAERIEDVDKAPDQLRVVREPVHAS